MVKLSALGFFSAFLLACCSSQTMPPKLEGGSIAIGFPLDKATEQAKSDCGKKGKVPKLVYSERRDEARVAQWPADLSAWRRRIRTAG